MTDVPDLRSELALLLSNYLCIHHTSSSRLKISKSWTCAQEYIEKELKTRDEPYDISTGSQIEGSRLKGSDCDIMTVLPRIYATTRSYHNDLVKNCLQLIMNTDGVRPGFSKLKPYNTEIPDNWSRIILYSLVHIDDGGSAYISSHKFREHCLERMNSLFNKSNFSTTLHGPCSTLLFTNAYGTDYIDHAHAIECTAWPQEAMEWVRRPRPRGWPSENQISKLKEMPCYLLPTGDPTSKHDHLEWRFAFIPTERELIWTFNDKQIHCLVILKMIKIKFLEILAPEQLSSFYFKTIILWETETYGLDMWYNENLFNCVHQCLETLKNSIKSRELPHYIYRKRNLLHSKFSNQQQQTNVVKRICDIQANIINQIFESVSDDLFKLAYLSDALLVPMLQKQRKEFEYRYDKINFFMLISCTEGINEKRYQLLEKIKATNISLEALDKKIILCILSIRIGYSILSEMCKIEDIKRKEELMSRANHFFEEGKCQDSTAGPLHLATYFYVGKTYKTALKIISEVCSNSNKDKSFYVGLTSKSPLLLPSGKRDQEFLYSDNKQAALDVIFKSEHAICLPHAVKFEFTLYGVQSSYFHPLVYAYYLYFQICLDTKNKDGCDKAIGQLSNFLNLVPEEDLPCHSTFNMLGFCFYKSGRYSEALRCFRRSLKVVCSTWNTASLHLWFMFLDMEKRIKK